MKISAILFLVTATLAHAIRFEFDPFTSGVSGLQGTEGSAFFEMTAPTGTDVPIAEAIASFALRGLSSGLSGSLPNIPAPLFTSLAGFSVGGTMTWDATHLSGFWSLASPPVQAQAPLIGATQFVVRPDGIDSKWPLDYFPSQLFLTGSWVPVPDNGSTLVLFAFCLLGIFLLQRRSTGQI